MNMLVTGGNRGLGLALCEHFLAHSVSRTTGSDITDEKHRVDVAQQSLQYDVFVNNAFDGPFHEPWADFGQTKLLWSVADTWRQHSKCGCIINIGSVGSQSVAAPDPAWETYRVSKMALKQHSLQWSLAFKQHLVPFRTSLLTLDRLDTELSRSRQNWTGNGLAMTEVIRYVELLINSPDNTCIEEIVSWVDYDHKQQ